MMESKKVFLRNMETGEEVKILDDTIQIDWCDKDSSPIDIGNSYCFKCDIKSYFTNPVEMDLYLDSPAWKNACRIADELNQLIEEYHAPGNPRKERRAIKRQFDKIFNIFRKHCQKHKIAYSFQRPNK